jgi:hypothetical protein
MERRTGPLYGGLAVRHIGIGRAYLSLGPATLVEAEIRTLRQRQRVGADRR